MLIFSANIRTLGFRTAPIMASRGAREGNNALNKVLRCVLEFFHRKKYFLDIQDQYRVLSIDEGMSLIQYAMKTNCSREIFDLLITTFTHQVVVNLIIDSIVNGVLISLVDPSLV